MQTAYPTILFTLAILLVAVTTQAESTAHSEGAIFSANTHVRQAALRARFVNAISEERLLTSPELVQMVLDNVEEYGSEDVPSYQGFLYKFAPEIVTEEYMDMLRDQVGFHSPGFYMPLAEYGTKEDLNHLRKIFDMDRGPEVSRRVLSVALARRGDELHRHLWRERLASDSLNQIRTALSTSPTIADPLSVPLILQLIFSSDPRITLRERSECVRWSESVREMAHRTLLLLLQELDAPAPNLPSHVFRKRYLKGWKKWIDSNCQGRVGCQLMLKCERT